MFTEEDDNVISLPVFYPSICDPTITLDDVVKILYDLKPIKVTGSDIIIPNHVLKESAVEIPHFLFTVSSFPAARGTS